MYFAEGLPYVIVMSITTVMYERLGLSNAEITLYTSWLYLPWVIKPFWSPIVDIFRSNRWWILVMQMLIGASLAGVAFTMPLPHFVQWSLCCFWLMAFSSATHDIAADGFYMQALSDHDQAFYVGIRSTCYRIATLIGQGTLVMLAGLLEVYTRSPRHAWGATMALAAGVMLLLFVYHRFALPATQERAASPRKEYFDDFWNVIVDFVTKPQFVVTIIFLLAYRLPEALLVKITPLFMLDSVDNGGLALSTIDLGLVQGTIGVAGLIVGGILGGMAVARHGFQRWLWPMVLAMSVPNLLYVGLAYYQPESLTIIPDMIVLSKKWIVGISYCVEQFGYGFGFTAYMMYMLYFSRGNSSTAHYAFCTGFMALSMMLPGFKAGWLQEQLGYYQFFVVVMALVPLTFIAASIIKVDPSFGKKEE